MFRKKYLHTVTYNLSFLQHRNTNWKQSPGYNSKTKNERNLRIPFFIEHLRYKEKMLKSAECFHKGDICLNRS